MPEPLIAGPRNKAYFTYRLEELVKLMLLETNKANLIVELEGLDSKVGTYNNTIIKIHREYFNFTELAKNADFEQLLFSDELLDLYYQYVSKNDDTLSCFVSNSAKGSFHPAEKAAFYIYTKHSYEMINFVLRGVHVTHPYPAINLMLMISSSNKTFSELILDAILCACIVSHGLSRTVNGPALLTREEIFPNDERSISILKKRFAENNGLSRRLGLTSTCSKDGERSPLYTNYSDPIRIDTIIEDPGIGTAIFRYSLFKKEREVLLPHGTQFMPKILRRKVTNHYTHFVTLVRSLNGIEALRGDLVDEINNDLSSIKVKCQDMQSTLLPLELQNQFEALIDICKPQTTDSLPILYETLTDYFENLVKNSGIESNLDLLSDIIFYLKSVQLKIRVTPLVRRTINYVYEKHLKKPYENVADPIKCGSDLINRPIHGLSHITHQMSYLIDVIQYLGKHLADNNAREFCQRVLSDRKIQEKIMIVSLFLPTGRESDIRFEDDPVTMQRYLKASQTNYQQYCELFSHNLDESDLYSSVIMLCRDIKVTHENTTLSLETKVLCHILTLTYKLDLMRVVGHDEFMEELANYSSTNAIGIIHASQEQEALLNSLIEKAGSALEAHETPMRCLWNKQSMERYKPTYGNNFVIASQRPQTSLLLAFLGLNPELVVWYRYYQSGLSQIARPIQSFMDTKDLKINTDKIKKGSSELPLTHLKINKQQEREQEKIPEVVYTHRIKRP